MLTKKLIGTLITLVMVSLPTTSRPVNTGNLAQTYTLLPKGLQRLSPMVGAVLWSKRIIESLYDDGHLTPNEPKNPHDPTFNEKLTLWEKSIPSTGIKKIVRALFNRPPGTVGQSDFRPSKKITENAFELIEKIAYNLAQLFWYQTLTPQLEGINSAQRKQRLAKALEFKRIGKATNRDFYAACNDTIYPGHEIIEYALLALLWITAHNDRKLIKHYFVSLQTALKNNIKNIQDSLVTEKAGLTPIPALGLPTPQEQIDAVKKFSNIIQETSKQINNLNPDEFDLTQHYTLEDTAQIQDKTLQEILQDSALGEIIVFAAITPQSRPPILTLGSKDLTFTLGTNQNVRDLRACFEIELRNLFNFFAFDQETKQYSVAELERKLGGPVHPTLAAFYATYTDPQKANTYETEIAWAKIITNLDNVAYLITSELQPPKSFSVNGYEKLQRNYHIRLTDTVDNENKAALERLQLYIPESPTLTHYELQGTFRNLVLILNHLLQLDLFAGKNLAKELIRDDFTNTYLPQVLARLGAAKNFAIEVDKKDATNDLGTLKCYFPQFQTKAKFYFKRGHADLELQTLDETSLKELSQLTATQINSFALLPFLISSNEYKKLTAGGFREIIPYFAHYRNSDNKNLLPDIAKQPLTQSWFTLLNYMETKVNGGYYASDKEKIVINALQQKLNGAKRQALDLIKEHKDSEKHFPKDLWTYLVQDNASFAPKALADAKYKIEHGGHYAKGDAIEFLTSLGLKKENGIAKDVYAFFQDILTTDLIPEEYRNFILFGIKDALLLKKIQFDEAKPIFDLIAEKSDDELVECLIERLQLLIKKKAISYQEVSPYFKASQNLTNSRSLPLEKMILLSNCLEKGMPAKDAAQQFSYITYNLATLDQSHHPYITSYQVTQKYNTLANKLLEEEPELQTDKSFREMIEKHLNSYQIKALAKMYPKPTS